jgi:tripartite-type tricarboxylate transporter receptor subunit TctC
MSFRSAAVAVVSSVAAVALGGAAFLGPAPAAAQDGYPVKPVRMIAPYPPGGTTDTMARVVALRLGESFGRQVVVENRPGAAGNIGHELAAKAAPDGYTLLLTSRGALVNNPYLYRKLPYDPLNDFVLITIVGSSGPVLVVHPTVPAKTVKELVALARARPGQLNYGSGGKGTTAHIAGEVFKQIHRIDIQHVPYKGSILAVTDLVAGQIELSFSDMVPAVPQIKGGRLRALAVAAEERLPAIPDVPTMTEAGVKEKLPDTWWGVAVPKGTPAAIVSRISSELGRMVQQPDVRERFASLGVVPMHTTPERMTELVRTGQPLMAKVFKSAGVEPE